jgi:hypothetical protein
MGDMLVTYTSVVDDYLDLILCGAFTLFFCHPSGVSSSRTGQAGADSQHRNVFQTKVM